MANHRTEHLMFSYQWDHQELVKEIYSQLQSKQRWNIWMDIHGGMTQSLSNSMAQGVENCAALICFLSEAYQNSANCKKELTYAIQLKKPIIPCILPSNHGGKWKPSDWLGLTIADLLYLDLSDINDQNFEEKCDQLIDKVHAVIGHSPLPSDDEFDH